MVFRSLVTSAIFAVIYSFIFYKEENYLLVHFLIFWSIGFLSILGFVYGRRIKRNFQNEAGTIKWFDPSKGYGFLVRDKGGDLFVPLREVKPEDRRKLRENMRVRFSVENSDKGPQAVKIEII